MSRLSEDLRERTKSLATKVIRLYVSLPKRKKEFEVVGLQLLRSGTSVAAHASEASRARSDAEFCSKLDGLHQEADQAQLWVELLKEACTLESAELNILHQELTRDSCHLYRDCFQGAPFSLRNRSFNGVDSISFF